ncbi:hypothetical protein K6Y31_20370 [Motilimonas cestriensis]|uniref:Uncharacterized protein n=1 Tax=Motilimonas cestriensis TaxID=2742685 RepID=A0ABS8WG22_9GAMM|nr:hypothetical protein [Motilimonas cestriensis]MCE2597132.1 hypothetical protein [Motilimonas cestriensis]
MHYWHGNGKLAMLDIDEIDVASSIMPSVLHSIGPRRKVSDDRQKVRVYYFKPEFRSSSEYLQYEFQTELTDAWDKLLQLYYKKNADQDTVSSQLAVFNELIYKYMEIDGWRDVRKKIARKKVSLTKKKIEISADTYRLLNQQLKATNEGREKPVSIDEFIAKLLNSRIK